MVILGTFDVDSQLGVTQQLCSERVLGTREEGFLVWCFAGQRGFFPSCTSFRDGLEEGHRCFLMLLLQNIDWSATRDTVCAVIYI
jgi:hypothetical protein